MPWIDLRLAAIAHLRRRESHNFSKSRRHEPVFPLTQPMKPSPFALLLLPASLALAQQPILLGAPGEGEAPATGPYFRTEIRELPGNMQRVASWGKTAAAALTGHVQPDVVILEGDRAVIATAPGMHTSVHPLPDQPSGRGVNAVADFAVLRGRGIVTEPTSHRDALAFAGTAGLQIWRRDPASGELGLHTVNGSLPCNLVAAHPRWPTTVFTISTAGTVQRFEENANGNHLLQTTQFPNCANAVAITCIEWDAAAGPELAVLTNTHLHVFGSNGAQLWSTQATIGAGQKLVAVRETLNGGNSGPVTRELLAWLAPAPNSTLHLCWTGAHHQVPLNGNFVGMTAISVDFDQCDDLLLTTPNNNDCTLLFNQSFRGAFPFAHTIGQAVRIALAAGSATRASNASNIAAADFDGDGDVDFFMPIEQGDGPTTFTYQETRYYEWDFVSYDSPSFLNAGDNSLIFVNINNSLGGTETQAVVWRVDPVAGLDPVPHCQFFLDEGSKAAAIPVTLTSINNGDVYWIMARPALRGSSTYVDAAKARIAYFDIQGGGHPPLGNPRMGGIIVIGKLPPAPPEPPDVPDGK